MNYYKIKIELEKRGISVKDFCRQVDITEQGLNQMIRNESMKVDVLERISSALNVPVSFWFEMAKNVSSEASNNNNKMQKTVSANRIDAITDELNKLLKGLSKGEI
ncbi:MAG: helix-turn-helix transcriptional regulator [Prevotellaceae bacterium]|jgi:transcriptional regulator with XRE-family HTH domain|nr:helix-turn-helix transcriptional regulator [Prevotellaceae bacterium]